MRLRPLGRSGPLVSAVGLGTGELAGYFAPDNTRDEVATAAIRRAVDLGMTFIDTAEIYGGGHTEEVIGRAIRGRRSQVFLATKHSPEHSRRAEVLKAAEASLRRLGTDYIDLYQTHWRNMDVPLEETADAVSRLVTDGKVRYAGVSNFSVGETRRFAGALGGAPLVCVQNEYNLSERTVEDEILSMCRQDGLAMIAYSPLDQGRTAVLPAQAELLDALAARHGASRAQLILAWLMKDPAVVPIPRSARAHHLAENAAASEIEISDEDYRVIAQAFAPVIRDIPIDRIDVADAHDRSVYRTRQEAEENCLGLVPSPVRLAAEFRECGPAKPVKVRAVPGSQRYLLIEGRLKYWAWVIAHDGRRPIRAVLVEPRHPGHADGSAGVMDR